MCQVPSVTCFSLPTFLAMLVKTAFMLKPLKAGNATDGTKTRTHTYGQTNIATYRLNQSRGQCSENSLIVF